MSGGKCCMCKEELSIAYKFKINSDNKTSAITQNPIIDSPTYCHTICPECLIRHIFIKDITVFSKPSQSYTFTCPVESCEKGKINLSYEQLIDVFQNKTFDNLQKKKEKICETHKISYAKYCKVCKVDICEECIKESYEDHLNHNIADKKILFKKLKKFFLKLNLRYYEFNNFTENFDKICKKVKEILENNYNKTLIYMDKAINDMIDFRAKYSSYYKEKVINYVQTLKILKLFYCNYYYDIKKADKNNDFKIYQYLNRINKELDDVEINDEKEHLTYFEKIKENANYLNTNMNKILNIEFTFRSVANGYRNYNKEKVDDKLIKSILKIDDNNKIIIVDEGLNIHYFEEKNEDLVKTSQIPIKKKIASILLFKNKNILASFVKDNHFNIWTPNEKIHNNIISKDDLLINKTITDLDISNNYSDTLCRSMTIQPIKVIRSKSTHSNNNNLYESSKSFLTVQKGDINALVEMDNSMFASGGSDKSIVIWGKKEGEENYTVFQKITKDITGPIKNLLFLYDKRLVSNDTYSITIWYLEKDKFKNNYNKYSFQYKLNFTNREITTIYLIRDGSIISGYKNSNIEIWSEIEGKYKLEQTLSLKIGAITCINQLKDDRIITGSDKGYIRILYLQNNNEYKVSENINTMKGLPIQCIECLEDGSFLAGQNITLHIWKNNESI